MLRACAAPTHATSSAPSHMSAGRLPKLTIVTPSWNGERFIREAVESIAQQGYPDLEHIVLDAGSTDGTLAQLAQFPTVLVRSEPDRGIYDALNKGVAQAHGEIIGFLNTDDLYPDGVLVEIGSIFARDPDVDVVVGQSCLFETGGQGRRSPLFVRTHVNQNGLWLPELAFGVPGFNGCFFRRRVFEKLGNLSIKYRITGDREFLMRLAIAGMKAARIDKPAILYRAHAGSLSMNPGKSNLLRIGREYVEMALELAKANTNNQDLSRFFLAWHAFESTKLVVRYVQAGQLRDALAVFVQLNVQNPLWPLRLFRAARIWRIVRRLDAPA
ncbi:MAG: glycosyltransferase [Xanthobacteraceae bacterium]|nr:glycosyltransferase [Xanthobacteraceae bacterium]